MSNRTTTCAAEALRELTLDECLLVAGGQSVDGAEPPPGGEVIEPNPLGNPVPPL